MPFLVNTETGDITTVQGDSGELVVEGLPTDKNYTLYFSFYDNKRKIIGEEMKVNTNKSEVAVIAIKASLTNLLKVNPNDDYAEYYYGLKICEKENDQSYAYEDTLNIGDKDVGELNLVTVYPKQVEGFDNTIEANKKGV